MSVVATISNGKVVGRELVDMDVFDVVKKVARGLLERWDPSASDFIVLRDTYTATYKAPISRELLEKIKRYSPKRIEDRVEAYLPVFEIIHGGQWSGESLNVGDATVVFPYVDEETTEEILRKTAEELAGGEEAEEGVDGDLE